MPPKVVPSAPLTFRWLNPAAANDLTVIPFFKLSFPRKRESRQSNVIASVAKQSVRIVILSEANEYQGGGRYLLIKMATIAERLIGALTAAA